jgi:predicted transposase YbfD/YdcC
MNTSNIKSRTVRQLSAGGMLALLIVGCGSSAVPNAEFANAKGAVSAAEASGAQDTPQASLYLKMSKDGLILAQQQMAEEQYDEARRTLEKAEADAALAASLTANALALRDATAAHKQIEELQNEGR